MREHGGSIFRPGLRVRIHDDDLVARYSTGDRYSVPVNFKGRLVDQSGGTMITGSRHHGAESSFRWTFWFATLLMTVVTVALLLGERSDHVGIAVSSVSAVLLGIIAIGLQATKGTGRAAASAALVDSLHHLFNRPQH